MNFPHPILQAWRTKWKKGELCTIRVHSNNRKLRTCRLCAYKVSSAFHERQITMCRMSRKLFNCASLQSLSGDLTFCLKDVLSHSPFATFWARLGAVAAIWARPSPASIVRRFSAQRSAPSSKHSVRNPPIWGMDHRIYYAAVLTDCPIAPWSLYDSNKHHHLCMPHRSGYILQGQ